MTAAALDAPERLMLLLASPVIAGLSPTVAGAHAFT
jgi:hypothetical protein